MNILALILAGGRVDDLGVLTYFRPKSIMPFGGLYRIIDFPLSNLVHSGVEKVGIFSLYRPFHLMEHVAGGRPWDMVGRDRFAVILPPFKARENSEWYQGTADAVYQNLDFIRHVNPDLVLILSGDHVYHMDYREMVRFHLEKGADVTAAFTRVEREGAQRFGLGLIEEGDPRGGALLDYVEKPQVPPYDMASLTIYLFRPSVLVEVLEENAGGTSHEFGRDIITALIGRAAVYGYVHEGYWGYTRTPYEYWQANMALLGDRPAIDLGEWGVMTNLGHRDIGDRQPALIGPRGAVRNSILYSGCAIDGTVVNSVLSPGVRVEEGAVVRDSILFFDTVVGRGAKVRRTIADVETVIGPGADVGDGGTEDLVLVGRGARLPEGVTLRRGVTVHPNLHGNSFRKAEYLPGEVIQ